ncbi:MAG: DNA polymerase III subunit delta [Oscillospiraceae bacterium]|jgi:DNA polymerase-3 subunit delta
MAKPKQKSDGSLERFKSELKEKVPRRLYVLHGEEVYLRQHYLSRLRELLIPAGMEAFNDKLLEGKEVSARDIIAAADCFPMMSEHTLVVVRDYDLFKANEADRAALMSYFADLPEYVCLVFVYDLIPYKPDARTKLAAALKEHGLVVDFPRQEQEQLVDWIVRRFKAAGKSVDSELAKYLIFLCGDLMQDLIPEIGKIAAYAKGARVTKSDVDAVAAPRLDAVVFQLSDAVGAGQYDKALGVLADLLHMQEPPQLIMAALGKYFRQLYAARVALEERRTADDVAGLWKMHPFVASKLMAAAHKVDLAWCRAALRRVAETDVALKTAGGDPDQTLTGLVLSLAYG